MNTATDPPQGGPQEHNDSGSSASSASPVYHWLVLAETALANTSDRLNAINIFPVPDGDTGTNLYITVAAARAGLEHHNLNDCTVGEALAIAGRAALDQARGNSGTLMAVILTGLSEPLQHASRMTAPLLVQGLHRAQTAAWSALSDPQEGTILSVLESSADAASRFLDRLDVDQSIDQLNSRRTLSGCCDELVAQARSAVVRTEEELEALTEAQVVDAGAMGLLLVLDALRTAVTGQPQQDGLLEGLHGTDIQAPHLHQHMPVEEGHELMCSLQLTPLDAATLRYGLDEVGDSVIMSPISTETDEDGRVRWRLHAHVPDPDAALELVHRTGSPENLVITALHHQEADQPDHSDQPDQSDQSDQ